MKYLLLFLTLPALAKPCKVSPVLDLWHESCWKSCIAETTAKVELYAAVGESSEATYFMALEPELDACHRSCNRSLYRQLGAQCTKAVFE